MTRVDKMLETCPLSSRESIQCPLDFSPPGGFPLWIAGYARILRRRRRSSTWRECKGWIYFGFILLEREFEDLENNFGTIFIWGGFLKWYDKCTRRLIQRGINVDKWLKLDNIEKFWKVNRGMIMKKLDKGTPWFCERMRRIFLRKKK